MRVLLDDRPIEIDPPSISGAIAAARAAVASDGRIVIEILADGQSIDHSILDNPPKDSGGLTELRFVTADPNAFVAVTLSDTHALLDEASQRHQEAADELMAGNREEAIDPLRGALESWAVVRDVIEKSSSLLAIDPRSIECDSGTGGSIIDGLTEKLTEIKRALGEQDDSALADVLAYDMPDQVERWRGLLGTLEKTAAAGRA